MIRPEDLAAIERYCEGATPEEVRSQMRIVATVDGDEVVLSDQRPPWDGEPGEWSDAPFASLTFRPGSGLWGVHWIDSDDRRRPYPNFGPTPNIEELLAEIDADPLCVFYG